MTCNSSISLFSCCCFRRWYSYWLRKSLSLCSFLSDLIQAQKLDPSSLFTWVMSSVSNSSPKGCGLELCRTVSRLLRICWDNSIGGHWLLKGDQFPKWYGKVGFLESLGNCHWQECYCMICFCVNSYSFSKCFTSATLIRKELNDLSFWIHNSVKKLETLTDILEFLRVERAESNDTEEKVIIAHLPQKSVVEVHKHLPFIQWWMLYITEATLLLLLLLWIWCQNSFGTKPDLNSHELSLGIFRHFSCRNVKR